ncbi:MAG: YbjQ family protein [Candidatus Methanospirare jalkutatii]|nr:YbjQ family protein [Candidatus Methanospirare jalkutatii]MCW7079782.1 YbjQ family protein [Candidatus Methanospirare jalkutatii]
MIVVSTDFVPGKEISEVLGLVKGNVIWAKHIGKDILAGFRQLVGGEIKEYTEMMSEAREIALRRMIQKAEELGADAVINVRFMTSMVMQGAAEILVYGTAVKLK